MAGRASPDCPSGQVGYPPIGDYAIIGDCRSAALVSRDGSIDWLCLPRFDSPSVFAAILDHRQGGRFRVSARHASRTERRYLPSTNVLETTFTAPGGVLRLTDAMPVADEDAKTRELWPDHEILRIARCVEGEVAVDVAYEPRMDYARSPTCLRSGPHKTVTCEHGTGVLSLRSGIALTIDPDGHGARGTATLRAGDTAVIGLTFADGMPSVLPADGAEACRIVADSARWWETWAAQCGYHDKYRDAVLRSALTLKLLTYAPSGAMVAAPTTSLPEKPGGIRNWDYRYCWLRDASLTLCALVDVGFNAEGESFLSWVLHATRLTQPRLQILYDVYGESKLPERSLEHLEGYAGSRPVRIGNDAAGQLQLDVYGEVIDAAFQYVERGGRIDRITRKMLTGLGETVVSMWREPDEGLWEPRGGRRQNTHSKVMCWVALDRLVKMQLGGDRLAEVREAIRAEIEARAWNPRLQSYTSILDGDALDASLLRMGISGYADPRGARMRQTAARIRETLGDHGLLYRYLEADGLPQGEGTFVICDFWAVEQRALGGELAQAEQEFERLLACRNDVGLLAEEIDPATGAALGNYPQAFSHVGLINAALTLARCAGDPQDTAPAISEKAP
jgi:GH15 family glucan-1,4-alpha-glucosidase